MQYEKLIRKIRQRIFEYYDESEDKGKKASRVLAKALAKQAKISQNTGVVVDRWGATASDRRGLARHGIAWGD